MKCIHLKSPPWHLVVAFLNTSSWKGDSYLVYFELKEGGKCDIRKDIADYCKNPLLHWKYFAFTVVPSISLV